MSGESTGLSAEQISVRLRRKAGKLQHLSRSVKKEPERRSSPVQTVSSSQYRDNVPIKNITTTIDTSLPATIRGGSPTAVQAWRP